MGNFFIFVEPEGNQQILHKIKVLDERIFINNLDQLNSKHYRCKNINCNHTDT